LAGRAWFRTEDSDLDILIDPAPEATMFDIGAIRHELRQLLGVTVDVLTAKRIAGQISRLVCISEARLMRPRQSTVWPTYLLSHILQR